MCSSWPEAVGDKQPRAALHSHCEAIGHMLRVGGAAALVKAGQEVAAKRSGRHHNYNPRKHGGSSLLSHFLEDLGLVRVASLMTVTQEGVVFVCLQQNRKSHMPVLLKQSRKPRQLGRRKKTQSSHLSKCRTGGVCSEPEIKINSVILEVLKTHCWHKPTELCNKWW